MSTQKSIIFLNFRYSERVLMEAGRSFDRVVGMRPRERTELLATLAGRARQRYSIDDDSFKPARFTGVMRSLIGAMFGGDIFHFEPASPAVTIQVAMEGDDATMQVDDVFACFSSSAKTSGVEGDDLVFCLILRAAPSGASGGGAPFLLDKRPKNYGEAIAFLELCAPALGGMFHASRFEQLPIPGFYLLPQQKWQGELPAAPAGAVPALPQVSNPTLMAVGSYLFYCWLICQRAERLLNQLSFEGDRDMESRKLILTRRKTVAALRFANVKNRAEPGTPTLPVYFQMYKSFRLKDQLDNLVGVSEEFQKTITLQENYLASAQLANIQWILFIFTILSLGVAFNALPVPPFMPAGTKNVLMEPGFWIVFGTVVAGAFLIWAVLHFSGRARRLLRRFVGWIFNKLQ